MLDLFNLPNDIGSNSGMADVQIFNRPSTVTNTQWMTWLKPRGKSMMNIVCIGGGGGGGGGFTRAAAAAGGGGGSGGSSAVTRLTIPLFFVPDMLYVQVGQGGQGVLSGGGTAGSGVLSYVSVYPNTAPANTLAVSGNAGAAGGGTGTGAAVGALGAAGSVATIANMPLAGLGHFDLIAGAAGVAGGAIAGGNGTAQTIPVTSVITSGGSGGAGTTSADFAGGAWTAISNTLLSEYRPATPAAGSNAGSDGIAIWKPLFFFGGTGGSSSNTLAGGAGGNGSYGCGGGGGGAGTTGGRGGNGGSGIVIITCW
jgi:hypothetical protein